jgi:hypothetical protein
MLLPHKVAGGLARADAVLATEPLSPAGRAGRGPVMHTASCARQQCYPPKQVNSLFLAHVFPGVIPFAPRRLVIAVGQAR